MRPGSTSETALARALASAQAAGAATELFGGAFMARLPIYNPDDLGADEGRARLLEAVRRCNGLIIATPGYHGSVSGLVKNALDGLDALRTDVRPYLDGRAVGCIVVATGSQAGGSTLAALRSIVHALRGWPTPFGATLNTGPRLLDAAGEFLEARDAWQVETVASQVVKFARVWGAFAIDAR